jgi:rubrerythrin
MDVRFFVPGAIVPVPRPRRGGGAGAAADGEAEVAVPAGSLHDPPLEPRDEAVFLLTAAAEVEHALMVQYLYAAYSVRVVDGDPDRPRLAIVRDRLLQIAREEMGHLATVENLLHVVGGPLTLDREASPYAASIHPFRFTLEPVTTASLAKYVVAESPAALPDDLSAEDEALLEQIHTDATVANGGQPVRHVGRIFERLAQLFEDGTSGLGDDDIRTDTAAFHASFEDWGFEPRRPSDGEPLIVASFPDGDVGTVRAAAAAAVRAIGAQGEGYDPPPSGAESHFERFFDLYKRVAALRSADVAVTWPVTTNPTTTPPSSTPPGGEVAAAPALRTSTGRITHPSARTWAQLFDLRYRLLLGQLAHFLRSSGERYVDAPGPRLGDRTGRGLLLLWTFDEMRHLEKIATKLVQLPKDDPPGPERAGPPFELPYALNLPDGERQRWRMHLDASRAAGRLVREKLAAELATDGFLTDLLRADARAQALLEPLARGETIPDGDLPTGFAKTVTILEEAVRGFTVGGFHDGFWSGRTRNELLDPAAEPQIVALTPDGSVDPDPDVAPLVERLEDTTFRMPRLRPAVPPERIVFIREWIAAGCPDDDPPGKVGVEHEREPDV